MASSVTFCCTRIEACSAWLTAVTGSSTTCRGRSRACSTAVATRPAAIRTGSGSGCHAAIVPCPPDCGMPGSAGSTSG